MFRIALRALLRVFLTCRILRRCKTNCGLSFSRQVIGAVVAQLFWLGVKVVFSRIAEDVVGKGLDHKVKSVRIVLKMDTVTQFGFEREA
ncbi:hypothetical protein Bca101_020351 [Brassica carinata]